MKCPGLLQPGTNSFEAQAEAREHLFRVFWSARGFRVAHQRNQGTSPIGYQGIFFGWSARQPVRGNGPRAWSRVERENPARGIGIRTGEGTGKGSSRREGGTLAPTQTRKSIGAISVFRLRNDFAAHSLHQAPTEPHDGF